MQSLRKSSRELCFDGDTIVVALVNNMPDGALQSTERQFRELLTLGARGRPIAIPVFTLPGVPRSHAGTLYAQEFYHDIEELWQLPIDGLIVTGTEPRAPFLEDEPYWQALVGLVEWAQANAVTSIWSCLAAHAAVQHLDGIRRCPLPKKRSGVFETIKVNSHPLVAGLPTRWYTPHSRCNEVTAADLQSSSYQILSFTSGAGVDAFAKQRTSLFLFLQGHLEYDHNSLLKEYQRDIGRFLSGRCRDYPDIPSRYFGERGVAMMQAFRERALRERDRGLLALFPAESAAQDLRHSWRSSAVQLYANWLDYVAVRKPISPLGNVLAIGHEHRQARDKA